MNATQSSVAIESIEIAHEGISQVPFVGRRGAPRWAPSRARLLETFRREMAWRFRSETAKHGAGVDGDVPLSPQTMDKIVRAVLEAVNDQEMHAARVRAEQRITSGVSHELEGRE